MALTAAQLEAILTLDKSQFDRALSQAEQTAQRTGRDFKTWGKDVGSAINDGVVLAATGAAGFAAAVTNVGIEYNSLQQRSRAALDTILGGTEAANAQMDKLNAFADNSPFARDVFIKAQQQLLGFGQEAERVVPTLEAIQDAVAATGGTNEDIAELVRIIAQLEGGVKLSAETLNQFGARGVDAAGIIGESMGKTGAQIREEITAGTLDADEAIVALTDGMSERFGGAAANVKETWDGATDRIKAATRDIGAEIARPFVDPMGGGRAIDWANDFADVLRALEGQLPGFVSALDDRLSPAFDNFRITMKDAVDTINSWDAADFDIVLDRLAQHAPGIAGLGAAMFTMATQNIPVIGGLTSALGPLPALLGAAALASPEMRDGLGDILKAGEPLIGVLGDIAAVASGTFTGALEATGTVLSGVADVIGPVVEWFADLPDPLRNAATAAIIFNAAGGPTSKVLENVGTSAKSLGGHIGNTLDALSPWGSQFEGAGADALTFGTRMGIVASDVGRTARQGLRGALNGVMGIFGGPWGIAIMGATALVTMWAQENQKAKERSQELAATLDEQTGAFTRASEEILNAQLFEKLEEDDSFEIISEQMEKFGVSVGEVTGMIIDQGDAYEALRESMVEKYEEEGFRHDQALQLMEDNELIEYIEDQIEAHQLEQEAIQAAAEAEKERYQALDEGERANERYKESIREVTDETINMSDRVKALKDALDELEGGTKTQEERDRELAGTQRDLNEWFESNAEEIAGMDEALIDLSTGMPVHTELGDQLNGILSSMSDDAHAAALEIYDLAEAEGWSTEKTQAAITEAYEPYIETLNDLEEQGFLTKDEVNALTEAIIGVPEQTAFAITHGDTVTLAELEVLELIDKIESTPDGNFTMSDGDTSQEAMDLLEDLGYEIRTIDDGEFEVVPKGIPEAERIVNEFVNKERTIQVGVSTYIEDMGGAFPNAPSFLPSELGGKRYHGGIDIFKGMAAGGITGASVMDIAQFVAPGDIRFAGDRSDVDEAWIPLDGSARSIAILNEAIARMPGYEPEAMQHGGITGNLTPPQVESVDGPDTTELEAVWAEAMETLEESTRGTFDTIQADTAESQQATTETTQANLGMMRDITAQQLALMVAATASGMASMGDDTTRYTATMRDVTGQNLARMGSDTDSYTAAMRDTTAARFAAMQQDGSYQSDVLRYNVSRQFFDMHDYASAQAAGLRSDSDTEFTSMRNHGVDAASDLRAGVVSEMSRARSPFTGHVNDLVQVMRQFSDAIEDAYGDMGVSIGKPNRISAATGAILPGWNPGVDNHTFTSPTGGILELSGGEGIHRPEVVQAFGAGNFMALNHAARMGGVRGVEQALANMMPRQAFADGGIMDGFTDEARAIGTEYKGRLPDSWLRPAGRSIIDQVVDGMGDYLATLFSGAGWVRPTTGRVTSNYGPRWGGHHAGMDIADTPGTHTVAPAPMEIMEVGWNIGPGRTGIGVLGRLMDGLYTYFGHNSPGGVVVRPGDLVAPGQRVGDQGTTGNVTGAHLHWEVHKGSPWNDINPHPFWDAAGAGGSAVTMPGGSNDMWTGIITQALAAVGLPTTPPYVNAWLTQGKTESGLNPRAVQQVHDINSVMGNHARGIVQVIPPTFRAYSLPGMKDIFNPLHNFAAGMNYAKNRYGVTGMLNVIGKGHGYEHGTDYALPGWAWVGEAGPELVRFRGGEQVMSNSESRAAVAGMEIDYERMGRAIAKHLPAMGNVNINNPNVRDTDELARATAREFRKETKRLARI